MSGFASARQLLVSGVAPSHASALLVERGLQLPADRRLSGAVRFGRVLAGVQNIILPDLEFELVAQGASALLAPDRFARWLPTGTVMLIGQEPVIVAGVDTSDTVGFVLVQLAAAMTSVIVGPELVTIYQWQVLIDSHGPSVGLLRDQAPLTMHSLLPLVPGDTLTLAGVDRGLGRVDRVRVDVDGMIEYNVWLTGTDELESGTGDIGLVRATCAYESRVLALPESSGVDVDGPFVIDCVEGRLATDDAPEPAPGELWMQFSTSTGTFVSSQQPVALNTCFAATISADVLGLWRVVEGAVEVQADRRVHMTPNDVGNVHMFAVCEPAIVGVSYSTRAVVLLASPYSVPMPARARIVDIVDISSSGVIVPASDYVHDLIGGQVAFDAAYAGRVVVVNFVQPLSWSAAVVVDEPGVEIVVTCNDVHVVTQALAVGNNAVHINCDQDSLSAIHVTLRDSLGYGFKASMSDWVYNGFPIRSLRYWFSVQSDYRAGLTVKPLWPSRKLLEARLDRTADLVSGPLIVT